jgi:hypothetical protein
VFNPTPSGAPKIGQLAHSLLIEAAEFVQLPVFITSYFPEP